MRFAIGRMSNTTEDVLRLVMDAKAQRGNETAAVLTFTDVESAKVASSGRGKDFFVVAVGNEQAEPPLQGNVTETNVGFYVCLGVIIGAILGIAGSALFR
jgi:hypothetical protein